MSTLTRILRVAAAGALVALAVAAPAGAATVKLAGGSTTLQLDAGTARALKGLGVSVTPITPAKAGSKGVSFPITGGTIDPATAAGTITHSGGLQLRAGTTSVRLTSFTIGVDQTPSLSVKAGKARLHAFTLSLGKAKVARAGLGTTVTGVAVKLSAKGAAALNEAPGRPRVPREGPSAIFPCCFLRCCRRWRRRTAKPSSTAPSAPEATPRRS